jgi:hypothetical protein
VIAPLLLRNCRCAGQQTKKEEHRNGIRPAGIHNLLLMRLVDQARPWVGVYLVPDEYWAPISSELWRN